jgi:hypothetical protein
MNSLTFENINFNVTSIQQEIGNGLTEDAFVKRGYRHGYFESYAPETREKLLREAFRLIRDFR